MPAAWPRPIDKGCACWGANLVSAHYHITAGQFLPDHYLRADSWGRQRIYHWPHCLHYVSDRRQRHIHILRQQPRLQLLILESWCINPHEKVHQHRWHDLDLEVWRSDTCQQSPGHCNQPRAKRYRVYIYQSIRDGSGLPAVAGVWVTTADLSKLQNQWNSAQNRHHVLQR